MVGRRRVKRAEGIPNGHDAGNTLPSFPCNYFFMGDTAVTVTSVEKERSAMSAYIMARIRVTDQKQYQAYIDSPSSLEPYGGRLIIRGGEPLPLEGEPMRDRMVVIEFPSREHARDWYHSAAYQEKKKLRDGAADASFWIMDGVG
jgi:uncharacterized protein (DUF1330 family)